MNWGGVCARHGQGESLAWGISGEEEEAYE